MSQVQLPIQVWGHSDRGRARPMNDRSLSDTVMRVVQVAHVPEELQSRGDGYTRV